MAMYTSAQDAVERGATVYQQFACQYCGVKHTLSVPNRWSTHGHCDHCECECDLTEADVSFITIW